MPRISDEVFQQFYDWYLSEPTKDMKRGRGDTIEYTMYLDSSDGTYGNCDCLEVTKWINNFEYDYDWYLSIDDEKGSRLLEFSDSDDKKECIDLSQFDNISEEALFQLSTIFKSQYASLESVLLMHKLSVLLVQHGK